MTEPIYRQLTKEQFQPGGLGRYWTENGRRFRITEVVPRMDGGANFQAYEVAGEPVLEIHNVGTDAGFAMPPELEGESMVSLGNRWGLKEDARAREEWQPPAPEDEMVIAPKAEMVVQGPPPKLADYARKNGWTGHGPISKVIREKYTAEFGVEGGRP